MTDAVFETRLDNLPPPFRGKVRDVYDLGDELLIVACDRISAYDHVLRPAVPDKGKVLSQLTVFWLERLAQLVPHHLVASDVRDFPRALARHRDLLAGRSMLVQKAEVVPFECVARGYLAGSGFRDYRRTGAVCGIALPPGLERASRLPEPIFTPATKAEAGEHDENVDFAALARGVGDELASRLAELTLALYRHGADHAAERGLILADTKFEFGLVDGELTLIDEALTPDSSRYWDLDAWKPGVEPASYDKQFVRNWLDDVGWDHASPPPALPAEVVDGTRQRYLEAFLRIAGRDPDV